MQTNFWCVAMLAGTMSIASTVMGAENNSSLPPLTPQANPQQSTNVLGVCKMANGTMDIFPTYDADSYMAQFYGKEKFSYGAAAKVIQAPKHGTLVLTDVTAPDTYVYTYNPDQLPSGTQDYFVASVENKGVAVNIRYHIYIDILGDNEPAGVNYCGEKQFWKISQDTNGNSILTAINIQSK